MKKHFSVVHEDFKPFYCSECNFRALKAFRVKTHIQKNHGGLGTAIHEASLKPRPVRHIPRILNRFRHQVQEEATKVPFYCPYCDFKSESQIEIGDHSALNHVAEHINRNAQPPDLKECNKVIMSFAR